MEPVLHIVPVELSKLKNDADSERMCVQIYGGAFNDAPDPGVTDFDSPMDDGIFRLALRADLARYIMRCAVSATQRTTL